MLFALGLLVLLEFVEELLVLEERTDLQHLLGKVADDERGVLLVRTAGLPPRVDVLAVGLDERTDFESNERQELREVADAVVLTTVSIHAGDAVEVLAEVALVLVVDAILADDFREALHELGVTREGLGIGIVHVVAVLGDTDLGFGQHDGERVGMRVHRLFPDERRRSVDFARGVLVLIRGAGLTVGMSVAHVVCCCWVWFRFCPHHQSLVQSCIGKVIIPRLW